ncbi:hypothetical protein ACROYT_G025987 [Oculina patagonica]
MNPRCARCDKTVYPMEKLNCLDKYWHKGCFSCEVCNMTLTMKNYKGYDKKPYCPAHYPTTKFTAVADTPENVRLAQNTKKQSNIQYHKDFEAAKGHYTAVADDPETKRAQQSAKIASQVAYTQHSSGQSRLGIQQRSEEEVRQIQSTRRMSQEHPMASEQVHHRPPPEPAPPSMPSAAPVSSGPKYRALYDYNAADDDEISFMENDIITEVTVIDDGWMEGRVERTGQYGMLPSNYVEKV